MCGIAGFVSAFGTSDVKRDRAHALQQGLAHRGPDGAGAFFDEHVGLVHRRLSIIDVAGGAQPLHDDDQGLVLIANGEIYNHHALRDSFTARGHRFRTRSDSEVILPLYLEHGDACVEHLRGMFAFALYDARRGRVLLARDRMGEKPLFVAVRDDAVWFSSELVPLARVLSATALDAQALADYFCFQFVPGEATAFAGIRRLAPGHTMSIAVDGSPPRTTRFWAPLARAASPSTTTMPLADRLEDVADLVVRADVPVGVALSGGLDSSLVAALAVRRLGSDALTFTVGYAESSSSDERAAAAELAAHLGVRNVAVELTTAAIVDGFLDLVVARDEPIADIAGAGYFAVAAAARAHDTPVLLLGHGGDELFWGYRWLQRAAREATAHAVLAQRGFEIPPFAKRLLRRGRDAAARVDDVRAALARILTPTTLERCFYAANQDWSFSRAARRRYLGLSVLAGAPAFPEDAVVVEGRADLAATLEIAATFLSENGLAQVDRLAMRSGVEPRLPLVDALLVEDVLARRSADSDVFLPGKAWLKEAARHLLPAFVLKRRKRGFTPPVARWHRALFERYGQLLDDGVLVQHGVLEPAAAFALSAGGHPAHEGSTPLAFKALVLELWLRRVWSLPTDTSKVRSTTTVAPTIPRKATTTTTTTTTTPAPIAVFAFNRPDHLHAALASLEACSGSADADVVIYCDGARDDADRAAVDAVRDVARAFRGGRRRRIVQRELNWGLARSVIAGVDEACAESGRVIVVEDDLRLSPAFLRFMNESLDRYSDDDRVMQVAGYMFPAEVGAPNRAFFLPFIGTWGWATWARAWKAFDPVMRDVAFLEDPAVRRAFDLDDAYPYSKLVERQRTFLQDSWAIRWYVSVFRCQGLALYPAQSLVENAGSDGSGTHDAYRPRVEVSSTPPSLWPAAVEVDGDALLALQHHLRQVRRGWRGSAMATSLSIESAARRVWTKVDAEIDPIARVVAAGTRIASFRR